MGDELAAIANDDYRWETDLADEMGQLPFFPPDVAGWPLGFAVPASFMGVPPGSVLPNDPTPIPGIVTV